LIIRTQLNQKCTDRKIYRLAQAQERLLYQTIPDPARFVTTG